MLDDVGGDADLLQTRHQLLAGLADAPYLDQPVQLVVAGMTLLDGQRGELGGADLGRE